jgi:AcrR family transcriptional regulator
MLFWNVWCKTPEARAGGLIVPRPRGYAEEDVLHAAKDIFWTHGYQAAAVSDLEAGTGLSRSSIYNLFGSKRELYESVLKVYETDFVDPMLFGMEHGPAGLPAVIAFFRALSAHFDRKREIAKRGCLFVNTLYEFPVANELPSPAAAFPARVRSAFTRCLRAAARDREFVSASVNRRAVMLEVATLGIWLAVRVEPVRAVRRCDQIADEVSSWRAR